MSRSGAGILALISLLLIQTAIPLQGRTGIFQGSPVNLAERTYMSTLTFPELYTTVSRDVAGNGITYDTAILINATDGTPFEWRYNDTAVLNNLVGKFFDMGGKECNLRDCILAPLENMSLNPVMFHYILGINASFPSKAVSIGRGFYMQTGLIEFTNTTGDVNIPWLGFKLHVDDINVNDKVIHARLVTPNGAAVAFMSMTGGYEFTGTSDSQTFVVGDVTIKVNKYDGTTYKGVPYFTIKNNSQNWIVLPQFSAILANISSANFNVSAVTDEIKTHYSYFATAINAAAILNTTTYPVKGVWGVYNVDGKQHTYIWSGIFDEIMPNAYVFPKDNQWYIFNYTYGIELWSLNEMKHIGCSDYLFTRTQEYRAGVYKVSTTVDVISVVRGMDNSVYYKTCLTCSYIKLSGSTSDSPSAVYLNGKLYIAVRGMDGSSIYFGFLSSIGSSSISWQKLPGSTPSRPSLTTDGSKLYLVVRGGDNGIYVNVYDIASGKWAGWKKLTGSTVRGPSSAFLNGKLHLVVVSSDGKSIYYGQVDPSTFRANWSRISGSTDSEPSLTTDGSKLYLVVRGLNSRVYVNTWSGSWIGWECVPTGSTPSGPASAFRQNLYIFVRGMDDRIYYAYRIGANSYSSWKLLGGSSQSSPAATAGS